MSRAPLRIYLGAAPGVGKTFAMLNEGFRRRERGADVVVGVVETHGRATTAAQLRDLEVFPRKQVEYRGTTLDELDLDGLLARRPEIVLVDELAHTNAPGSRNEKRWQDVDILLDAGIEVITTVNVQHLESLNDVVAKITGTLQRETVPDAFVRRADQIELVDMSPEALRRRMAHGNIYPAERIDAALSNYFRPGNLGALRELALLWVADRVEETLAQYLDDHGITTSWETRERIVVAMTGRPGGEALVRRAARMAGRVKGELVGVHVVRSDGIADESGTSLADQRKLVFEFGGTVHDVSGDDAAEALVQFARAEKATQLVLGASGRTRWHEWWHGSFISNVIRLAGDMDVHVIARNDAAPEREARRPIRRVQSSVACAWLLTMLALPILTVVLARVRDHLALSTILLLFLSMVLLVAALGGRLVAAVAAIVASLLVNWYFVPPIHTFTIDQAENIVSLAVFLAVALTVGTFVDLAARRSIEASRARVEAEALTRAAGQLAGADPVPGLLDEIRTTFALRTVCLAKNEDDRWVPIDTAGESPTGGPPTTVLELPGAAEPPHRLELYGQNAFGDDRRLLRVLADQVAVAVEARSLQAEADEATVLADIDALRTALLRAVSHDLRTPLASIKAMVSGLRDPSVTWRPEQMALAHATIEEETDRLTRLVANLLDASRLQTGSMAVQLDSVDLENPVRAAINAVPGAPERTTVVIADDLPPVLADTALVERVVANLLSNALRHSPADAAVRIVADRVGEHVHLCVIDRGPGIPPPLRSKVLVPFQRLGDESVASGVGLGLSIAQGFVEALHGTLTLDDTPGGGLTVTVGLPAAVPTDEDSVMTRVLVVDDEPQLRKALGLNLTARGYDVVEVANGSDVVNAVVEQRPSIVLLDLGLPGLSGLQVIELLRRWSSIPIIVLTARDEEASKVQALDAGADDYVAKPFGMGELMARLRATLRRAAPKGDERLVEETAFFRLDLTARRAFVGEERTEQRLTPIEWDIVDHLVRHSGRLVTHRQLLDAVWGAGYEAPPNLLRVHVAHVRQKLEPTPSQPIYFLTEPGMGFRYQNPASSLDN